MSPGPMLDLILEQVRESDKESFRKKILAQEQTEREARAERGEMTRDMAMKADLEFSGQVSLELEERETARQIGKDMLKEEIESGTFGREKKAVEKEEKPIDNSKSAMDKFLENFK